MLFIEKPMGRSIMISNTAMLGSQVSFKDWQSAAVPPPHVARQQVFLGYRVVLDANLVERLYDKLKAAGVNVWWD